MRDRVRPGAAAADLAAVARLRAVAGAEQPTRTVRGEHRERRFLLRAEARLGLGRADARVLLEQPVGVSAPAAALAEQLHLGGALAHEHLFDLGIEERDTARR